MRAQKQGLSLIDYCKGLASTEACGDLRVTLSHTMLNHAMDSLNTQSG